MPGLGRGLGLANPRQVRNVVSFASLPNLPVARQEAVRNAAIAAAVGNGHQPQDFINALGRSLSWIDWRNSFTDTGATAAATVGNAVAANAGYVSSRTLTQSNAPSRPTYSSSGLTFDGGDRLTGSDSGFPSGNVDRLFVVSAKFNNTTGIQAIFTYGSAIAGQRFSLQNNGGTWRIGFLQSQQDGGSTNTNNNVISVIHQSSQLSLRVNGSEVQAPTSRTLTTQLGGTSGLELGAVGGINFLNGTVWQFIATTTLADRVLLERFVSFYDSLGAIT